MRKTYKTLANDEYDVLNKVSRKTGLDCWFCLRQDCRGVDYVYDAEEGKRMCLKTGVGLLAESLDCQENFDNCLLDYDERQTLRDLFQKLNVATSSSIDWRL